MCTRTAQSASDHQRTDLDGSGKVKQLQKSLQQLGLPALAKSPNFRELWRTNRLGGGQEISTLIRRSTIMVYGPWACDISLGVWAVPEDLVDEH
jgi:hypothetical protein